MHGVSCHQCCSLCLIDPLNLHWGGWQTPDLPYPNEDVSFDEESWIRAGELRCLEEVDMKGEVNKVPG